MTTLLVATIGGHLTQLADLFSRLDPVDENCFWVTNRSPQSESLLAGEAVTWVSEVTSRDVRGVARNVLVARRMRRDRGVTRAISTGSGIALGYLPYLAARGVECHFIESAARVEGPSLTGRLLERVPGVQMYTQYSHNAVRGWQCRGSVFDGFERIDRATRPIERVLVTVGTITEQFTTLVARLLPLIGPGGSVERSQGTAPEVVWQTGHTDVSGFPIEPTPFVLAAEFERLMGDVDLVVGHAGVGSALTALRCGRCPVLVPRRVARAEIVDDHQVQVAKALHERSIAVHSEVEELSFDVLQRAASASVARRGAPPAFRLGPL